MVSKLRKFIFISLLVPFALLLFAGPAEAADVRTKDLSVDSEEVVDDDLYLFGDEAQVDGVVMGDLMVSGGQVNIKGIIQGDVYVFGGLVDISGEIDGSVLMWSGQIDMSGPVGGNVYVGGGQVRFSSTFDVAGDILVFGGQINVDGKVGDDVRAAGAMVDIDAKVGGDVFAPGGEVQINEDKVSGDIKTSEELDSLFEEASKAKEVAESVSKASQEAAKSSMVMFGLVLKYSWWIGMYLVGAILIWMAPVKTKQIVGKISNSWKDFFVSLVIGAVAMCVCIVLPGVLAVTVVGIPLSVLVFAFGLFMIIFGGLWADMAVGRVVYKLFGEDDQKYFLSLLIGRIIRLVLSLIPFVGGFYDFVMGLAVAGGLVRAKYELMGKKKSAVKAKKTKKK